MNNPLFFAYMHIKGQQVDVAVNLMSCRAGATLPVCLL